MNLREIFIDQVGSTIKILACTGDFPVSNIVRVDYSDWETCVITRRPFKEMLV
jgi:hypothetical protein